MDFNNRLGGPHHHQDFELLESIFKFWKTVFDTDLRRIWLESFNNKDNIHKLFAVTEACLIAIISVAVPIGFFVVLYQFLIMSN